MRRAIAVVLMAAVSVFPAADRGGAGPIDASAPIFSDGGGSGDSTEVASGSLGTKGRAGSGGSERPTEIISTWTPAFGPDGIVFTPFSVLGTDDRSRINPTTEYPNRASVVVIFGQGFGRARCSGFMISADTVATAGHCVHTGRNGVPGFFDVSTFEVYPAVNGTRAPFGMCRAEWLATSTGFAFGADDRFDYGAIRLAGACQDIGRQTGWLGLTSRVLIGQPTVTRGYPGDKPLTLWRSRGNVKALNPERVFYDNDTMGGQSGSPVIGARSDCYQCVVAIHAYGVYGRWPFASLNHGTRITPSSLATLMGWIARGH